jgi:hypothetical protein
MWPAWHCRRLEHPDRIPDGGVGALLAGTVLGLRLCGVTPARVLTILFAALGLTFALKLGTAAGLLRRGATAFS